MPVAAPSAIGDREDAIDRAATATPDGLLRHVIYLGEREDKSATEVRRSRPHASDPGNSKTSDGPSDRLPVWDAPDQRGPAFCARVKQVLP